MANYGLLIQQDWCTGCHACEVACKQEHNFNSGRCGIIVHETASTTPEKVYVDFTPTVTRFCDLCIDRTKKGEQPACVKHCQATCMMYGKISDLAKTQEKQPRSSLWAPK
jgi:Fe-S-cluster-containing dehydrogenase component